MKKSLVYLSLTCLLVGLLSLVGCKKEETTEETTPATTSSTTTTETSTSSTEMSSGAMGGTMGSEMGTSSAPMGTDNMGTGTTPPPAK
jgi:hypothetical protein